jgi:hypothetical protein
MEQHPSSSSNHGHRYPGLKVVVTNVDIEPRGLTRLRLIVEAPVCEMTVSDAAFRLSQVASNLLRLHFNYISILHLELLIFCYGLPWCSD